tara:strand:- start:297 stop:620 length:324 start_codon:yes stop_codon:yes gene_type:complete
MKEENYGSQLKKYCFEDTDKRYGDFRLRLHVDELKQGEFFRAVITGYLEQDEELLKFLDKFKTQAKIRRKILKKSYADARRNKFDFGFSEEEVKNIFDIIAQEGENK